MEPYTLNLDILIYVHKISIDDFLLDGTCHTKFLKISKFFFIPNYPKLPNSSRKAKKNFSPAKPYNKYLATPPEKIKITLFHSKSKNIKILFYQLGKNISLLFYEIFSEKF